MEDIYDDVDVTTIHDVGDANCSPYYQGLVPVKSSMQYSNTSPFSSQGNPDLYRTAYKSLLVKEQDDLTNNEYATADQSGASFQFHSHTNDDNGMELDRKVDPLTRTKPLPSIPPPKRNYINVNQSKRMSICEQSAEEDQVGEEIKSKEETTTKRRNFKAGCLCCLVLLSLLISMAALATATVSIAWCMHTLRLDLMQQKAELDCLVDVLRQNGMCCKETRSDCWENGTWSTLCTVNPKLINCTELL